LREEVYDDWASKGLDISALYMQRLVDLCKKNNIKITIAVYPWTNLIMERDLHSKMVVFWADFTKKNNIAFLNYFPDFINDQATSAQVIDKYFLPDDIHWNEQGHELIANEIIKYSNLNNK
jgi:lysophospholipase L1-like esterase